ncbi:DUF4139 domain-containing protein [Inhella proteolytica]|uniref:DUF4139 domain-containing protein n=1 Tax=Inhella proteolytica TaxID=2795029 RepID=A0A931J2K9_9BURK|nr:DUF4139 domain-containing protein [Inhella proteolytica]MBH9577151.1 DUF4139 domain-containing protein [Inhella proteolytica]
MKPLGLGILALMLASHASAQGRLVQALVYPGGAELTRVAAVKAGAQEFVWDCLPAGVQTETLRAQGSTGLRVGDLRVENLPRERAPECSANPGLDARIRTLEEQRAALLADKGGLDLVLHYLRGAGQGEAKAPAGPQAAMAEHLRRQGSEALKQQAALQRKVEDLDRDLKPLRAQRDQEAQRVPHWLRATVRLSAARDGELSLSYQTSQASWAPRYQADLLADRGEIAFERHAEVRQSTGEAWRDIQLVLSTRQPQRQAGLPDPQPWVLSVLEPPQGIAMSRAMAAPAPAAAPQAMALSGSRAKEDHFEVVAEQTDIDLQFTLPGRVSLAADNESRSFTLEQLRWPAQWLVQVQPRQSAQAFVRASFARPQGFFPPGRLLLLRDGRPVGQDHFALNDEAEQQLFFGPEERLRVRVEPEQRAGSDAGFIGPRKQITLQRRYVLENRADRGLAVQVVEAAPHSQHADIKVQSRFEPPTALARWRELDGVHLWRLTLGPGQSQVLKAEHQLSAPREMPVAGWP